MQTFKATDDLLLDAWPSAGKGDQALLKLRSLSTEADNEPQAVIIYADEVRHLVEALTDAEVWLADQLGEVGDG